MHGGTLLGGDKGDTVCFPFDGRLRSAAWRANRSRLARIAGLAISLGPFGEGFPFWPGSGTAIAIASTLQDVFMSAWICLKAPVSESSSCLPLGTGGHRFRSNLQS